MKTPTRHYRPNFTQFLVGHRLAAGREFWRFEARILGGVVAAYGLLSVLPELEFRGDKTLRDAIFSVGIGLLGYMLLNWVRFKKRISKEYEAFTAEPPALYAVRDEGIEVSGSNTYGIERWEHIDHWSETHDSVFLFGKVPFSGVFLLRIVSKNQFNAQEIQFLIDRLLQFGIPRK